MEISIENIVKISNSLFVPSIIGILSATLTIYIKNKEIKSQYSNLILQKRLEIYSNIYKLIANMHLHLSNSLINNWEQRFNQSGLNNILASVTNKIQNNCILRILCKYNSFKNYCTRKLYGKYCKAYQKDCLQKSIVIISGKELQDFLAEIGNWIQENQLYAGHVLSSELGHLDAAFRTLLLKQRSHVYGEEQFIMEERLKGNIVLNKSEIDDISHYLKKTQYYIKLELGIFDSEDFNKNNKSKRLSIKNKLKRNK
jgi:hypothetical protein